MPGPHAIESAVTGRAVLVLAPALPEWDKAAGDRRLEEMLTILARECATFVAFGSPPPASREPYERRLRERGIVIEGYGWSDCISALLRRSYSHVLYEFYFMGAGYMSVARAIHPNAFHVVDSVDVHFLRIRAGQLVGRESDVDVNALEREEMHVYHAADSVLVITDEERRVLQARGVHNTCLIPIILPVTVRTPVARDATVLFVGNFRHPPNVDGIHWFVSDIWPIVRRQIPNAQFEIVGAYPPDEIAALDGNDGVVVHGYVEDLRPLLDRAAVSVAPLRYGGGMKGKVCQALASGVPVVTTPFGVQGLADIVGDAVAVGDTPASFASAVLRILSDEQTASRMSSAATLAAEKGFSVDIARTALIGLLHHAKVARELVATRWFRFARYHLARRTLRWPSMRAFGG